MVTTTFLKDPARTRSVWLWMKREEKKHHIRRHHYLKGQPGDLFLYKLSALFVDLSDFDEDGNLPITETAPASAKASISRPSPRISSPNFKTSTKNSSPPSRASPPPVFLGHSIFYEVCGNLEHQLYMASILNSFVIDWTIRQRVTANISLFYLKQLPIPRLKEADPDFRSLVERAARLVGTAAEFDDLLVEIFGPGTTYKTHGVTDLQDRLTLRAQIDALVARLYGLSTEEFQHILSTLPLVDESVKTQIHNTYRELVKLAKFV